MELILLVFGTIMIPSLAWLLVREFRRNDQRDTDSKALALEMRQATKELTNAIVSLKLAMVDTRQWTLDKFIRVEEHNEVKENISRLETEFERCFAECPYRNRRGV